MFSTLFTLALLAVPAIQGVLAEFAVNSPALTQCKESKISWEATNGPYNLIVVPAAEPCGDALADLGDHTGTSFTWKPTLPAGTKVQLSVEDADGEEAWSQTITVEAGDDTSCLPGGVVKTTSVKSTTKSSSSSTRSSTGSPSTLVVTPTTTVEIPGATDTITPEAVGAAGNAGANPLGLDNGALTMRQASTPVMVLGALAAVLAISL
ncbi:hypothetical protein Hypma_006707 [Hypsizygus marmoreus]|uniref:Uncharacterized protein n=1 Tax=Hypsizygus marmoreus TaxID=39966 RepID=A0A369K347_HYPMA|nr:hypothetical protein Hypma_006707 [Hypsizygus marmoreus]